MVVQWVSLLYVTGLKSGLWRLGEESEFGLFVNLLVSALAS